REKAKAKRVIIRLNAFREDLNFFDSSLYYLISARNLIAYYILLDCGVSYIFIFIKTARCLGGRIYEGVGSRLLSIEEGRERDPKLVDKKGRLSGLKG
ncbi:hypothetical protein N7527_004654, partial [Penicillium freii]